MINPRPPRLIVLDAGGTLVDCTGPTRSAQLRQASPLDDEHVHAHVHADLLTRPANQFTTAFIEQASQQLQVPPEAFPYQPGWPQPESYQLREDAAEAVSLFRQLSHVVVLSNVSAFDDVGAFLCRTLGFSDTDIYTSHHIGLSKPDPRTFALVAADHGVDTADLLVVGDSWRNDVLGGRAAGARTCWLQHEGQYRDQQRHMIVHDTVVSASLVELAHQARRRWWTSIPPARTPGPL